MLSRRSLLLLGAAALGLIVIGGTSQASAAVKHGKAKGHWDLPSKTADGHVKGVLLGPKGKVVFQLKGKLTAKSATDGEIDGALVKKGAKPGTTPFAVVKGKYKVLKPGGKGHFEADIILIDPTGTNPPKVIGKIKGKFKDPKPQGKPGKFKGKWALK